MVDAQMSARQVECAREAFFSEGRVPDVALPPYILRSWQRSRPVEHDRAIEPEGAGMALLHQRREQALELLRCAQPELDGLAEHVAGNGWVVILSDACGFILEESGSPEFLPKAQRLALQPGMDWSERSRGTNAIGTALAEGQALAVLGREHYLEQIGAIGCAAAPIFSGRGEMLGALDISGDAARIDRHALGLVRLAAGQVEHRMTLSRGRGDVLRFHHRPGLLGSPREGLLMVDDGRIVAANRIALGLLQRGWGDLLDVAVEDVMGTHWGALQQRRGLLSLPNGRQFAVIGERMRPASVALVAAGTAHGPAPLARDARSAAGSPVDDALAADLAKAVRVLNEGVPILVGGETGTGKEVFTHRLHAASRRGKGPLVAVDCASLPEGLIEAELFGYEEGAYTGARRKGSPGRIREAEGGILFLDEIGDMPLALQTRLLRVLESRCVVPLGGGRAQPVDFDLVCATHADLTQRVEQGLFRADLMHRMAGYRVQLPPLRSRPDRQLLIERLFAELGASARNAHLSEDAIAALQSYGWPGNIRELRSVLRTVLALCDEGQTVMPQDLPAHVFSRENEGGRISKSIPPRSAKVDGVHRAKSDADRDIDEVLAQCSGHVAEAARVLGVHRSTVYRHLTRRLPAER